MQDKQIFDETILRREMTRKEFLQYTAGLTLTVVGVADLAQRIWHFHRQPTPPAVTQTESQQKRHGFGASKFGV